MAFVLNPFTGQFDAVSDPIDEPISTEADCSAAEAVGDCVYVSADAVSGVIQVRKVDVTDSAKMPAIGMILDKATSTTCTVALLGTVPVGALPAFVPGKRYFVGASSKPVAVPPATPPVLVQVVGIALDSGRLLFNPSPNMTKLT